MGPSQRGNLSGLVTRLADTGLSRLSWVEHEVQRIRNETAMLANVKFVAVTGAAASVEGAVQAFRDHRWVHVAYGGTQHANKPFESWFAMPATASSR